MKNCDGNASVVYGFEIQLIRFWGLSVSVPFMQLTCRMGGG